MSDTIGSRLREARERAGLSARGLAEKSGLKSPSHVSLIESGQRPNPSGDVLMKIAKALDVSVDWLLTGCEGSRPRLVDPDEAVDSTGTDGDSS